MPRYRLYFVGREGRFVAVEELDCVDDGAAVEAAQRRVGGGPMELWDQGRRIMTFAASPWRIGSPPGAASDAPQNRRAAGDA